MDTSSLRNTPALIARIERLRDELIKRFESLVGYAGIDRSDRTLTAVTEYQMQVETAALIRAAEDFQVLIRQLQEMWLFGQLDTMGDSAIRQQTEEKAGAVAQMLERLLEKKNQQQTQVNGTLSGHRTDDEAGSGKEYDENNKMAVDTTAS